MNVTVPFNQTEEAQLTAAAKRAGLAPADLIKRLALEHLPSLPMNAEIDAKLRLWQEQDGSPLMPDISAQDLFALWADQDAKMTDEERTAEDRLWEDIENSLADNKRLSLRQSVS